MTTTVRISTLLAEKPTTVIRYDCSYHGRINAAGSDLIRSYEGIPEDILVNLVILLLLFAYLRRRSSNSKSMTDGTEISTLLYGQIISSSYAVHNVGTSEQRFVQSTVANLPPE
ncbi:unnamed protein product [Adineta steineri]|uniref:Uncharacterized protein n=1 Tax=Adineta steineri TaxID=433720 RepID=A0A819UNN0_9BILA|nr:unnamed protein product [Adineta steineri]